MSLPYVLLIVIVTIVAILMCFIVLIQNSKGGGLSAGFSSSNNIMGVRKTTDFIEKATWGLAAAMVVLSVAASYVHHNGVAQTVSTIEQKALQEENANPLNQAAPFAAPADNNTQQPATGSEDSQKE
ncbi:MAG: preprotein translocase subunit SecG [Bacteroidaceae bacterium]|nr:preprotein translocase subunit SecG [Bacteroidaceae bacterium]